MSQGLEFLEGHFITQKTLHKFSMTAHNQMYDQLIAVVKGDSVVLGITKNESALWRWMMLAQKWLGS